MSESKYRFSTAESFGVWRAHEYVCFWCEEPVEFRHMTVDHLVPEHLMRDSDKLTQVLAAYGLPSDFNVNDFSNWVPAHQACNGKKGAKVLAHSPAMILSFETAARRAAQARKVAREIDSEPDQAKAIARIELWLKKGIIEVSALSEVADRHLLGNPVALTGLDLARPGINTLALEQASRGEGNDPIDAEIDVFKALADRHLYDEALEGLSSLKSRLAGAGRQHALYRIANNSGVCLMGLGRPGEARECFLEALVHRPDDVVARVNVAATYYLDRSYTRCLDVLEQSGESPAVRGKRLALVVGALVGLGRGAEVDFHVRGAAWAKEDAHVQLALARWARADGNDDGFWHYIQRPIEAPETAVEANFLAGMHALGVPEGREGEFAHLSTGIDKAKLKLAHAHFRSVLDLLPKAELTLRAEVHANCGVALLLMGDAERAVEEFRTARSISGAPGLTVVVNHAAVLMQNGEFVGAAQVIRDSGLAEKHPLVKLQLATALQEANRHDQVIEELSAHWRGLETELQQIQALGILLRSAHAVGRADLIDTGLDSLEHEFGKCWLTWMEIGRHWIRVDRREQASAAFARSIELVPEDRAQTLREEFAFRQASWGDHEGCAQTLSPFEPEALGNSAVSALVVSLYHVGHIARARSIARSVLNRTPIPKQVLEVAGAIASSAGDVHEAIHLQERLLTEHAPTLHGIVSLAKLYIRQGDTQKASAALGREIDGVDGRRDPFQLMTYAHLLSQLGSPTALDYGYQAWGIGLDQPQVQLGYILLFLRHERTAGGGLEGEVIEPGMSAVLIDQKGGRRTISVVRLGEVTPDPSSWVHAKDGLAQKLVGRQVGDEISGPNTLVARGSYRVERVHSNYVRAFQETIAGFNDRFPDAEGLWKVEVPKDDPHELTRVLLTVLGRSARVRELVDLHSAGRLPAAALANALRRPFPIIWSALASDQRATVRFSDGLEACLPIAERLLHTAGALPSTDSAANTAAPVLLDYSALMTLVLLGEELCAKVVRVIGPVAVTQSLLDDLAVKIALAIPRKDGDGGFHVSLSDEGLLRVTDSQDERGFLSHVDAFVRRIATSLPAYAAMEVAAERREPVTQALGRPTSDLMWEAAHNKSVFLCDDAALAALGHAEFGVRTTTVQAVAFAALQQDLLSLREYSLIVERLSLAKYSFLSVNVRVVGQVLQNNDWQATEGVAATFAALADARGVAVRTAGVVAEVLRIIALEPAAVFTRNSLVDLLLGQATVGHDPTLIIGLVDVVLSKRLMLFPSRLDEMKQSMMAWLAVRRGDHVP